MICLNRKFGFQGRLCPPSYLQQEDSLGPRVDNTDQKESCTKDLLATENYGGYRCRRHVTYLLLTVLDGLAFEQMARFILAAIIYLMRCLSVRHSFPNSRNIFNKSSVGLQLNLEDRQDKTVLKDHCPLDWIRSVQCFLTKSRITRKMPLSWQPDGERHSKWKILPPLAAKVPSFHPSLLVII